MKSIKHILSLSFAITACNAYSMESQRKMNIFEYFNQQVTERASKITNQEERTAFITNSYSTENLKQLETENELHNQAHFAASHLLSINLSPAAFEKASEIRPCAQRTCPTPNRTSPEKTQLRPLPSSRYGKYGIPPHVEKSINWKSLTY